MVTINHNYNNVKSSYLFSEIARRTREFQKANPDIKIMRLGIGNTTEPLPSLICEAIKKAAMDLGTLQGYSEFGGYGAEQGRLDLRTAIAADYYKSDKKVIIDPDEVFIGDGAKSDLGNIQGIFGRGVVALQDPAYPAYLDVTAINGRSGKFNTTSERYDKIVYMCCTPENNFATKVPNMKVSLIYLCSPNNPTGAVMRKSDLEKFVEYAQKNKSVIIFDAAYSSFISEPDLPKSIYEISEAKKCAIEINSFSKSAGFTGLRLGWTIVPKELVCDNSKPGKLNELWNRRQTTFFNGASNVAQKAGLAALTPDGKFLFPALLWDKHSSIRI